MRPGEPERGTARRTVLAGGLSAALAVAGLVARPTRTAPEPSAQGPGGPAAAGTGAGDGTGARSAGTGTDGKAPAAPHGTRPFPGTRPFVPLFPYWGLVTNEYAHRHPGAPDARASRDWTVTSGSLLGRWGGAWSGVPDGLAPDPASRLRTGSAVLRVVSARRDFGDVRVAGRFLLRPPVETPRTPATDWDGGHLWLRYRSAQELYALSFCRRDGTVVIKRKAPPAGAKEGAEGVYTTLAQAEAPLRYDTWHHVAAQAVTTASGTVLLRLLVDRRTVVRAEDPAPGALAGPGGVGVRGDNTELFFQGFTAARLFRRPRGRTAVGEPAPRAGS